MSGNCQLCLIVCTYCRPEQVRTLLESVARQTRLPDETLIVDASPDNATADLVERLREANPLRGLRYAKAPPEHRGLTRQRNYGIALLLGTADDGVADQSRKQKTESRNEDSGASRCPSAQFQLSAFPISAFPPSPLPDVIAFLDDDTILEPEYFAELLACFERHPDAVGVGGYITNGGVEWRRVGEEEQKAESRKQKTERTAAEETQGRSLPAELPAQPGPPPPQVSGLPSSRKDSTTSFGVQVLPASRIPKPASRITHHASRFPLAVFRWGEWERPEDARWVLRKRLGLGVPDEYPPGWLPPGGHNHSCTFYPPDGKDHRVESLIGCSFAWRASLFQQESFSEYFVGYGLYEDLEFCIRALGHGNLYMCTRARLEHHHAPSGRPRHFHYGVMVVRNGWYVWRQRWALPPMAERWRWWAVTLLLTLCRLGNVFSHGQQGALPEACGRFWGMLRVLVRPPR